MFQIQNTLVSLDVIEKEFCCDLQACKGCCCIEGEAGAPITEEEEQRIRELLPELLPHMTKQAREVVETQGISYLDPEGERVAQIVNGKDCVFARTDHNGWCYCLIEKLYRQGKTDFRKPFSCYLYPIRLKEFPSFTAVEYHRWDICHPARQCGKRTHTPLYEFLREPLSSYFGEDFYEALCAAAKLVLEGGDDSGHVLD